MSAKTATMNDFKSPEIQSAVRAVLMAKALYETTKAHCQPHQVAALEAFPIYADLACGERITDWRNSFLTTNEAQWTALLADYGARLKAAGGYGLTHAEIDDGKCPELVNQHLMILAENALLALTCKPFGLDPRAVTGEKRAKFLDLTLRMVVSLPGFTCELPKAAATH